VPTVRAPAPPPSLSARLLTTLGKVLESPAFIGGMAAFDLARTSGSVTQSGTWQLILERIHKRFDDTFGAAEASSAQYPELKAILERMSAGPQDVIGGPVTTQPSGVQDVNLTNPPPRPNVNVAATFNVYEAQDADAFSRDVGRKLSDMVSGVQADLEATPGY